MGEGLGCGRGFGFSGGYSGTVALCIAGILMRGVVKKRRFPEYSYRSSLGAELQRNLMFSPSYVVIVRWESLFMDS